MKRKKIDKKLNLKMYETAVTAVVLYAAKTMCLTKSETKRNKNNSKDM